MTELRGGLLPFDPVKHARFRTATDYSFSYQTPTYPIDKTGGLVDWRMGGNGPDPTLTLNAGQPVGDCGPCAVPMHSSMMIAVLYAMDLAAFTLTTDQVVTLYFEYTGGQDTGVDLGDWLLWLFNRGAIRGFVAVPLPSLDAALATFDVVVVGVHLNPQADQQVASGGIWEVGPGDRPNPQLGHAILYAAAEAARGRRRWISWGQQVTSTFGWYEVCPVQAFAVLTKNEALAKGFPLTALEYDLKQLGGTVEPAAPSVAPPVISAPPVAPASGTTPPAGLEGLTARLATALERFEKWLEEENP